MPGSREHLSQTEFFDQLEKLFKYREGKDHGSIQLSQKRFTQSEDTSMSSANDTFPDLNPSKPLPIIIRASNAKSKRHPGKKVTISTIVQPQDLDGFYERYAEVCKAGMTALKPRDRKKKKAKAKKKTAAS